MGGTATPAPSPEIEIVFWGTAGDFVLGTEGGPVRVEPAPQGGVIMRAGVRSRGMHACLQLTAAVFDEQQNNRIVSFESRPAQQVESDDGWSYPFHEQYLFNYANLPVCPNAALTHPLLGDEYRLQIQAVDRDDESAAAQIHAVPYCQAGDEYCETQCLFSTAATATFTNAH